MINTCEVTIKNDKAYLSGEISFANALCFNEKVSSYISSVEHIVLDFSDVTKCNSVIVALVIEWIKLANVNNKTIELLHSPETMLSILKAAKMETILPQ